MPEICLRYAWDIIEICMRYAWAMPELCLNYAWDIPEICLRYTWDILEISLRYAWDMPEMCLRYAGDMSEISLRYSWHIYIITGYIDRFILLFPLPFWMVRNKFLCWPNVNLYHLGVGWGKIYMLPTQKGGGNYFWKIFGASSSIVAFLLRAMLPFCLGPFLLEPFGWSAFLGARAPLWPAHVSGCLCM